MGWGRGWGRGLTGLGTVMGTAMAWSERWAAGSSCEHQRLLRSLQGGGYFVDSAPLQGLMLLSDEIFNFFVSVQSFICL